MHVTKPSLDVDDFGCEYTALCCISTLCFFLSHAAGLHRLGCHGGGFLTQIRLVQRLTYCSNCNFIVLFMFPLSVYRVCYFCVVLIPFALS